MDQYQARVGGPSMRVDERRPNIDLDGARVLRREHRLARNSGLLRGEVQGALLGGVDDLIRDRDRCRIRVRHPEFVVAHWWEYLLHNQVALRLKAALLFRPGVAVLNIPQHLRSRVPERRLSL